MGDLRSAQARSAQAAAARAAAESCVALGCPLNRERPGWSPRLLSLGSGVWRHPTTRCVFSAGSAPVRSPPSEPELCDSGNVTEWGRFEGYLAGALAVLLAVIFLRVNGDRGQALLVGIGVLVLGGIYCSMRSRVNISRILQGLGLGAVPLLVLLPPGEWAVRVSVEAFKRGINSPLLEPLTIVAGAVVTLVVTIKNRDTLRQQAIDVKSYFLQLPYTSLSQQKELEDKAIERSWLVGRDPKCDIHLADTTVSRIHARVFVMFGNLFIEDLSSTNGTYVNGVRITFKKMLRAGDRVRIGGITIPLGQQEFSHILVGGPVASETVAEVERTAISADGHQVDPRVTGQ